MVYYLTTYLPKGNLSDGLLVSLEHLDVVHVGLPVLPHNNTAAAAVTFGSKYIN